MRTLGCVEAGRDGGERKRGRKIDAFLPGGGCRRGCGPRDCWWYCP